LQWKNDRDMMGVLHHHKNIYSEYVGMKKSL